MSTTAAAVKASPTSTNVLLINHTNKASESKKAQQYVLEKEAKHLEEQEKKENTVRTLRKLCDERLAAWERACEERIERLRKVHAQLLNAARDEIATCESSKQRLFMMSKDPMHRMTSSLKNLIIDDFTTVCQAAHLPYISEKPHPEQSVIHKKAFDISKDKSVTSTDNMYDCSTYTSQLKQWLSQSSQNTPHTRVNLENEANDNQVIRREERAFMTLITKLHNL